MKFIQNTWRVLPHMKPKLGLCSIRCLSVILGILGPWVQAQFVATEVVYHNAIGPVAGTNSTNQEFGDELILEGDNRKVVAFSFEYNGQFEADGDETVVLRFYRNDGESLVANIKTPGTLIYQSEPFAVFPDYNFASITGIDAVVPERFTFTVQFSGMTGLSTDRAGLVLRHPPHIGKSYDDIWVRFANGWAPYQWSGDPIANFACQVTAAVDTSVSFQDLWLDEDGIPTMKIRGPRNQTMIVYGSADKKTWSPMDLRVLKQREFTLKDTDHTSALTRYYRATLINNKPIEVTDLNILGNGKTRVSVSGPNGMPFTLQATGDFKTWEDVFTLAFRTRPIVAQDDGAKDASKRFYRIVLNDVTVQDEGSIQETIVTYPQDFEAESE
jgi:hypothetical protein